MEPPESNPGPYLDGILEAPNLQGGVPDGRLQRIADQHREVAPFGGMVPGEGFHWRLCTEARLSSLRCLAWLRLHGLKVLKMEPPRKHHAKHLSSCS